MATFKYHIVDASGRHRESNIPDRAQAETFLQFLKETTHDYLEIVEERVYTVKGLGRDPDLH